MLKKKENKEYLAIEGLPAFRKATIELLLGADSPVIKEVTTFYSVLDDPVINTCILIVNVEIY